MGITALCLVGLGVAIGGYFWQQSAQAERERDSILASASTGAERCTDPDYPVLVTLHNGSRRTVERVSFMLQGRRPNHSDTIFNMYRYSDYILAPDKRASACFSVDRYGDKANEDVHALEWAVDVSTVTFR